MKLGVIGGTGRLGSAAAFTFGLRGIADEIKIMGHRENLAVTTVMDMEQALLPVSKTKVTLARSYEDFSDCDVMLCAAAAPFTQVTDRSEELKGNMEVIAPICEELKKNCKSSTVLLISANPVDVLVYACYQLTGWGKGQILGLAVNDTIRMKWATAQVTGRNYRDLDALCIGEHGHAIQIYESLKDKGVPFTVTEEEKSKIESECVNWFANWQAQKTGTTTGWTSGVSLAEMLEAIMTDSGRIIPCSTVLAENLGYPHCALGLPVVLGKGGAKTVAPMSLNANTQTRLDEAADKISCMISGIGL